MRNDGVLAFSKLVLLLKGDYALIINGSSSSDIASQELVEKLNLVTKNHPNHYHIEWVDDKFIFVCLVNV